MTTLLSWRLWKSSDSFAKRGSAMAADGRFELIDRERDLMAEPPMDLEDGVCHGCGMPINGKVYVVGGRGAPKATECGSCWAEPRVAPTVRGIT
jgi:hypothetical protein